MSYEIINKNLEKLEKAVKTFPHILGKYRKSTDSKERSELASLANKVGLSHYVQFIDWLDKMNANSQQIIYRYTISFDLLKTAVLEGLIDKEAKDFLEKKTKRGFNTFFGSDMYQKFNGGYKGRGWRRRGYSMNFSKSEAIIANYIIQNGLEKSKSIISHYYKSEIPNFEAEVNTELEITQDITRSIIRKINSIKYDFRKLNYNLLQSEINNKIREMMKQVTEGEQIKCIEASQNGLTLNKIYNVKSYEISGNGNLVVYVISDMGHPVAYNYRLFESVSKARETSIDDILNFIEDEG